MHHISPEHFKEWLESAVAKRIIRLSVESLRGTAPYEYLLYSPEVPRRNDGRIRDHVLRRYVHVERGGWWCSGLDPLNNFESMLWGCFKPESPKRDDKGKLIKYEHPPKTPTRIFCLRIPLYIWKKIAARYNVAVPGNICITVDGEAVGFWAWAIANKIPIIITEGAKKAACLLSAGYAAIALPGITGGYRSERDASLRVIKRNLIPDLEPFLGCPLYICFDNDTKQTTRKSVTAAIESFGKLLVNAGSPVKVLQWHSEQKGADDYIVANGAASFEENVYLAAKTFEQWQSYQYTKLTYPVSLSVNRRYLGTLPVPEHAKLICLKSNKGTGKTQTIAEMAAETLAQDGWVLVLTHRMQLGEALCQRFKIPYVTELKTTKEGKVKGYGLCIDSLHPYSQADFEANTWDFNRPCLVILDECEQVIWHTLNSTTCKEFRIPILKQLRQLLTSVLTSQHGRVVLSDADQSDVTIDYVLRLSQTNGLITPWVCENTWKPSERWQVYNYLGTTPVALVKALERHIEAGGKPFVCLSSQKVKSKWGTKNLEAHLRQKFPDKKILRIDSETISDPTHPAFGCIAHLDEILSEYDIVLASPTIETGVSIDRRGHFTSVWGIFQGVSPENTVRQSLARVREPVDRHVWIAKFGMGKIGNGATSIKSVLASEKKICAINIQLLKTAEFDPEAIDQNFDPVSLWTWAKMATRINAGMIRYRNAVLDGLALEGHEILEAQEAPEDSEILEALKQEITTLKDTQHQLDAEATSDVDLPTKSQYEGLTKKKNKTELERRQERKYSLWLRYQMPVNSELLLLDDAGWHPALQLYYYLTIGRCYLMMRDRKRLDAQVEQGEGALWIPDFNKGQLSVKVHALDRLEILAMLQDPEREFRATDPDVIQLADRAKACSMQVRSIFGFTVKPTDAPMRILSNFLSLLGLKTQCVKREGPRGNRVRVYRAIDPVPEWRESIYQVWQQRDRDALEKWLTAQDSGATVQDETYSSNSVSRPGNNEYRNQPVDTPSVDTDPDSDRAA